MKKPEYMITAIDRERGIVTIDTVENHERAHGVVTITREQAKALYPETPREARKRKKRGWERRRGNQTARRELHGTTGITAEKSKR